ncbi:MAG: 3-phosphoshikimate 1-carboxyvinyltransferase [Winogradskyella sp.]|nr:3-phosphoshikimate 1-carboxyvinyltransferase [Winogradskyella sp.]
MQLTLSHSTIHSAHQLNITGSKSESNRLLLLQALFPDITIENLSNSDDTRVMQKALSSTVQEVDVHHAGTAMRFLTAYFATRPESSVILTGSHRMKERPIKILVDALQNLGADITYKEKKGYPPLRINGKKLTKASVSLDANVSSQYISALLLVAPSLSNGLELKLNGKITSLPYIEMTLSLLKQLNIKVKFQENTITVEPHNNQSVSENFIVESDWSSASYYYSFMALSPLGTEINLTAYKKNSLQGDSVLQDVYEKFGVSTVFKNNSILIKKESVTQHRIIELDLINSPDIAQTIAITAFGLGIECLLTGLHTLKIKETDRLLALKTELEKFGATVEITEDSLHLKSSSLINRDIAVDTYNDHRMAMAFAPLCLKTSLMINDADVVNKSYPGFWDDLASIGITIK